MIKTSSTSRSFGSALGEGSDQVADHSSPQGAKEAAEASRGILPEAFACDGPILGCMADKVLVRALLEIVCLIDVVGAIGAEKDVNDEGRRYHSIMEWRNNSSAV